AVHGFIDPTAERERKLLALRLQVASDRLAALGPRGTEGVTDDSDSTAHELLAHLAVLSKFYGVMVHRVAGGKLLDMDLLQPVNMRDAAGRELSHRDPGVLVGMTVAD